jgi:glycine/D-amino acid oxidase-like deaminating enzyme
MSSLQHNRRGHIMFERVFPAGDAYTPLVAGLESRKSPFRMWRHQIIAIQNGKIEELSSDLNTYGMQTDILGAGATVAVSKKSG